MERHRNKTGDQANRRRKPKLWQIAIHDEEFCNCPMNLFHEAQNRNYAILKQERQKIPVIHHGDTKQIQKDSDSFTF